MFISIGKNQRNKLPIIITRLKITIITAIFNLYIDFNRSEYLTFFDALNIKYRKLFTKVSNTIKAIAIAMPSVTDISSSETARIKRMKQNPIK
jgi:hypothetical protein